MLMYSTPLVFQDSSSCHPYFPPIWFSCVALRIYHNNSSINLHLDSLCRHWQRIYSNIHLLPMGRSSNYYVSSVPLLLLVVPWLSPVKLMRLFWCSLPPPTATSKFWMLSSIHCLLLSVLWKRHDPPLPSCWSPWRYPPQHALCGTLTWMFWAWFFSWLLWYTCSKKVFK